MTVTEPIEVGNELLRASRELDRREDGLVVTLRVENENRRPVKFQLFDPLPGRSGAETVRFHPDDQPSYGRIDTELAVVGGVVEPEEPHVTRYAVQGAALPSAEELHRVQERARPSIEIADIVEPEAGAEAVDAELERAAMTRAASRQASPDPGRTSADSSALAELWAGMEPTSEATDSARAETTAADPDSTDQPSDDDDYPSLAEVVLGQDEAYRDRESDTSDGTDGASADAEVDVAERLLEQLEEAAVARSRTEERLEGIDETLAVVATRTERLDDRIGSLRQEHRTRAAEIESRVEALEAELEALVRSVEAVEAHRQSVWRAFFEDHATEE